MSHNLIIDPAATRWSELRPGEDVPLLVLLHGYGADEGDLFSLTPLLPTGIAIASVAAPLAPPWPTPGRSWYPIEGLHGREPEGVTAAGQALLHWLETAAPTPTRVALLGFSQGAAVAVQALRLVPERFGAVVALSGYAAGGELPHDESLRALRPRVFWGRGSADDVIPAELIDRTAQWLPDHANLTGRVYPGLGHSISEGELADVRAFLEKWRDEGD